MKTDSKEILNHEYEYKNHRRNLDFLERKIIEHISELSDMIILYFADQTWTSFSLIKKE